MKNVGRLALVSLIALVICVPMHAQMTKTGTTVHPTVLSDKVGVGTSTAQTLLDVGGWTGMPGNVVGALANIGGASGGDLFFGNAGSGVGRMRMSSNANQGFLQWNLYYTGSGYGSMDVTKPGYEMDVNAVSNAIIFRRYGAGPVAPTTLLTIGGNGDLTALGTISGANVVATYQDVAEWVPSTTDLTPGTVVVLNPEKNNEVMISGAEYDTAVAGVVSAQPGLILGVAGSAKEMVATTGRVKVRVDATAAPIAVGDLLVTSSKPGMAMKSQPIKMQGRSFHQPGTIIGKALEPLKEGEGEILVLLSMQ
jgi:hypothetical protein